MTRNQILNYFLINLFGKGLNIASGIIITPILLIVFEKEVFVLFDPLKSADPPIN